MRTATWGGFGRARICLVAASPSMTGMRMSVEDDVRPQLPRRGHAVRTVARLAHDVEVAGRLEHRAQAEPHQLLVVHQQHADGHAGSSASISKPPSSRGSAVSRPPRVRTRSANPTSP